MWRWHTQVKDAVTEFRFSLGQQPFPMGGCGQRSKGNVACIPGPEATRSLSLFFVVFVTLPEGGTRLGTETREISL